MICHIHLTRLHHGSSLGLSGCARRSIRSSSAVVAALLALLSASSNATVLNLNAFKTAEYQQTSSAQPSTPSGYRFNATVITQNSGDIADAEIMDDNSATFGLTQAGARWDFGDFGFLNQAALDGAHPDGSYTFLVNAETESATLDLSGDYYSPAVPYLTGGSYASLQGMSAAAALTINWNAIALAAGAAEADVFLTIIDDTASVTVVDQFLNQATTYTITGGTLQPAHNYRLSLFFSERVSSNLGSVGGAFDNATALAAYDRTTTVAFSTASDVDGDGVPDSLDNCKLVANPNQRDTNGDGYGNLCDPDFNGDGTVNINDFNRLKARLNITPVVDVDTDLDGNGAVNINDFNRLKSFLGKPPGPSGLHPNCPPTCP
jgi:hypothetical protein